MNTAAVIPIRFADCCHDDGSPKLRLQDRPLWEWTFEQARQTKQLQTIIVAYDDERFAPHLEAQDARVLPFQRPPFLSGKGYTTLDVLVHVAKSRKEEDKAPDYYMLLEITHPLRPPGVLGEFIDLMQANPVDSLVTVRPVHYNFWKRDDSGTRRIVGSGDDPVTDMYSELLGIGSLFRASCAGSDNPFGESSALAPIEGFWSRIDARNEMNLWLAEAYLKRLADS